ncbi:NAD-glutamate dehydrogenase [Kineosporia sp. NBRC 101731]|uniref:NAD-glutamate dehydrogenase n=1 Tax=Kineosporia sp. NBRC 101731 TaxID=3032199 RepID=UPI0025520E96|nr:NAD-glutamate dehydrogenase [Kineosporia sp. NBRC 101731]
MSGGATTLPTIEGDRQALLAGAQEAGRELISHEPPGEPPPDPGEFLHRYYRNVALDDLRERTSLDLAGLALSHRQLAAVRPQGKALVRVLTPTTETDGWSCGHTVIEIVVEDMPFLVDSVNAELARLGCELQMTIHPQFVVRRDITGSMLEVLRMEPHLAASRAAGAAGQPLPRDAHAESWIHVEVGRETDPERVVAMERGLRRVLDDVRVAVEDWPKMRATADRIAGELLHVPPIGPARAEVEEGAELLRWLAAGHFTFIGYREYDLVERDGEGLLIARTGTGLGVLRHDQDPRTAGRLTPKARVKAREQSLLVLTKANSRSTVHRAGYLDYIGVKVFDAQGRVTGERRFLGLYASTAYTADVRDVPVISRKAEAVLATGGFTPDSHSGKDLLEILQVYPRDELFEIDAEMLAWVTMTVMQLQERRRTRLFLRVEDYGRYVSCLVFLPRDRYVTSVRLGIERVLREAIGARTADYTARVTESVLARLHFVVRVEPGAAVPDLDLAALEQQLVKLTRSWDDDFAEAAAQEVGDTAGARLVREWGAGIGQAYRVDVDPRTAVEDLCRLDSMDSAQGRSAVLAVKLYELPGAAPGEHRFVLYRREPLSLSAVLPYLSNLGVEVVDERPYAFNSSSGRKGYIYDFGLRGAHRPSVSGVPTYERLHRLFCEAFESAWWGEAESDGFERLVLTAGLDWRQVSVLRGYARYLRQTGSTFGQDYIGDCLVANSEIAVMLVELFEARFDPDQFVDGTDAGGRAKAVGDLVTRISTALDNVSSLDQDRILRSFLALVQATTRTNRYLLEDDAEPATGIRRALAFKLDPHVVPDLPAPRPAHEIFVYSPWVEGVHLRFGAVARGGLRWSDRREDFRTEILGLVKAQMVKNAVIVPTGAKGGFVAKQLPDPAVDRDAWLAEGIACYRSFIGSLLDVTDNRVMEDNTQRIVPPPRVFRHDGDDSYLVVAADKGTAAFSDLANEVAACYGFWLGDAFASGGSVGYDHKVMGITARGAWESVDRHFRELGHDVSTMRTTAVGIGDMSGDVFGNGMLLSKALQLVAAFDHRHIFLDPDPDPQKSYDERARMFRLPRSSWADYDTDVISKGGGVHPRSAKSIPITPEVAQRLGIPASRTAMPPNELMKIILGAPVDLLWNGGIGTYVKASSESHGDAGDKANDAIRLNGRDLRARVVGEGGNLGLTQLGRVEAALCGVRVNTDAIDNSAGVDCSDHEVNIKILLDALVTAGRLDAGERTELLASMTDDVARLVLRDNYEQNVLLGNARQQSRGMLPVHQRFIQALEARGALNRALEHLPDDTTIADRKTAELGLTSPEFSVLVAYAKLTLTDDIVDTELPDDPWLDRVLTGYFPPQIGKAYGDALAAHPLRRQIVTTCLVNDMVNRGGITFAHRCQEETGAEPEQIARAYIVAREIFGFESFARSVEALDGLLSTNDQAALYLGFRRLLDRAVRWFIQAVPGTIDIAEQVARFGPAISELAPQIPELVAPEQRTVLAAEIEEWKRRGVPEPLARQAAGLLTRYMLLDITQIAGRLGADPAEVARVYLTLSERYGGQGLLRRISGLPRSDRWKLQARASLRADLYAALESLTVAVLTKTGPGEPADRISEFEAANSERVTRVRMTLEDVERLQAADVAALSVVLRSLRSIV